MSEFESFQVDLSANNVSDDDDMGAPVVRRRGPPKGVTFGESTTAPPNEQRINGCNGGGVEEVFTGYLLNQLDGWKYLEY